MRRVLGLHGETPRHPVTDHPTITANGSHPQRRRFVRDGEVPVIVVNRDHRRDDASGANQLDAARQAIRSQAAARDHAERLLVEAQATVRSLQTALAHERLAKDEAILRAEADKRTIYHARETVQGELVVERAVRDRLERSVSDSEATISSLEARLERVRAELATERRARQNAEAVGKMPVEAPANRNETAVPTVRRPVGRPRKILVVRTVETPAKASAKAKAPGVTAKAKGSTKPDQAARRPAGKPVKWWLTA
jgi:hypothetical protein